MCICIRICICICIGIRTSIRIPMRICTLSGLKLLNTPSKFDKIPC